MLKKAESDAALTKKILNSQAVNSLLLEKRVYELFRKHKWNAKHSPYYTDNETNKFREIDIVARNYWEGPKDEDISCSIEYVVECKSIKDYHIIVNDCLDRNEILGLIHCWIGNDVSDSHTKILSYLLDKGFSKDEILHLLKEFDALCYPEGMFKFVDNRVDAFVIPTFNSFRETNISVVKDLDNSVVWKSFQSLNSCIKKLQEFEWDNIQFELKNLDFMEIKSNDEKINCILESVRFASNHITYVHPLLVIESNLWKLENGLKSLNYFRLVFQEIFGGEIWVDIVNIDFLDEYLKKAKYYDKYLISKGFEKKSIV
jgi:hypothetical protein